MAYERPHPATQPTERRRTRRALVVVLTLATLLLSLYALPLLPPVRAWLLGLAQDAASRTGFTVRFERSAGNLWHGLTLSGVRVTGPGVDAELERVALGYALGALPTGTLPLGLELSGVRGDLHVGALADALRAETGAPRGPLRVTPVLRRAEVADVALTVDGTPLDVADLRLTDLTVQQRGERVAFGAALTAGEDPEREARASVRGSGTLAPLTLEADVHADVALARPFFDGLEGGTLAGTVRVDEGGATGELRLEGGAVTLAGIELEGVSGPVRLRGRALEAELSGRALGGPLSGTAAVDLEAQRWEAAVTGDAALAEAAAWLAAGRAPLSPEALGELLGLSGRADVALTASGWQDVTLSGTAVGAGALRGAPLRDLRVDFGFETATGARASATGRLGGAPFRFSLTPADEGFWVRASGAGLPLAAGVAADLELDLTGGEAGLTGGAALALESEALGREAQLELRAQADGDTWRLQASGADGQGARLAGEATLAGEALTGALSVSALELPGVAAPVDATLRADGPLGALPLTLELAGDSGVRLGAGGVTLADDLSGSARATLAGTTLEGLTGRFGPLALTGALDLAGRAGELAYTLEPTPLAGRAAGRVGVRGGTLTLADGELTARGTLQGAGLRGAGVTLPTLDAPFTVTLGGDAPSATLRDPAQGVALELGAGRLRGAFEGTPVGALGETFAVTGTLEAALGALTDTLALDLRASAPGTQLTVTGDAAQLGLELAAEAGATLAGRTLGAPLTLAGEGSLRAGRAALAGALGAVGLELAVRPDAAGALQADATLRDGESALRARLGGEGAQPGDWTTDGTLPLGGSARRSGCR